MPLCNPVPIYFPVKEMVSAIKWLHSDFLVFMLTMETETLNMIFFRSHVEGMASDEDGSSDVEQISCSEYTDQMNRRKSAMKPNGSVRARRKSKRFEKALTVISLDSDEDDDDDVVVVGETDERPPPSTVSRAPVAAPSPGGIQSAPEVVSSHQDSPKTSSDSDDCPSPIIHLADTVGSVSAAQEIAPSAFESSDAENLDELYFSRYAEEHVLSFLSNGNVKFHCRACDRTLANEDRLKQHLSMIAHVTKKTKLDQSSQPIPESDFPLFIKLQSREQLIWNCLLCKVQPMSGRKAVMAHLRTHLHKSNALRYRKGRRLKSAQSDAPTSKTDPSTISELRIEPGKFPHREYCSVCDALVLAFVKEEILTHKESKLHRNAGTKKKPKAMSPSGRIIVRCRKCSSSKLYAQPSDFFEHEEECDGAMVISDDDEGQQRLNQDTPMSPGIQDNVNSKPNEALARHRKRAANNSSPIAQSSLTASGGEPEFCVNESDGNEANYRCKACNVTIKFASAWAFHLESLSHRRNVELLRDRFSEGNSDRCPSGSTAITIEDEGDGVSCDGVIIDAEAASNASVSSEKFLDSVSFSSESLALSDGDLDENQSNHEGRRKRVRQRKRKKSTDLLLSDATPDHTMSSGRPKRKCAEDAENKIKNLAFLSSLKTKQLSDYNRMMQRVLIGEDPTEDSPSMRKRGISSEDSLSSDARTMQDSNHSAPVTSPDQSAPGSPTCEEPSSVNAASTFLPQISCVQSVSTEVFDSAAFCGQIQSVDDGINHRLHSPVPSDVAAMQADYSVENQSGS